MKFTTSTECRLSFPYLFKPDDNGFYRVKILIPKSDSFTIGEYNKAFQEVAAKAIADHPKWGGKLSTSYKANNLKDGDLSSYPEEHGHWTLEAKTRSKPGVVDQNVQPILDQGAIYGGVYARVSMTLSTWDNQYGVGLTVFLNNVQKVKDGEKFGGSISSDAASDFGQLPMAGATQPLTAGQPAQPAQPAQGGGLGDLPF